MPDLVPPAFSRVPSCAVGSNGEAAAELAALAGLVLDAEQRLMLDAVLSVDAAGRWAAIDSAIICPRQNGKTVVLQAIALADLFLFDARLVTWTAHLFPTAQEAFRDLEALISGCPEMSRRVKAVSRANGEEGFELFGDQRLQFVARSKTRGRGLTGDRVILDEAFAISAASLGSLYPTMSARPNPSVVYASSAGMVGSDVLRALRDRGRAGDETIIWIEWCAPEGDCADPRCMHDPGMAGCLLDDWDRIQAANPALGRRISTRYVESERRALPPAEFARERLGWWDEPAVGIAFIAPETWAACADRAATIAEPCTLGVDVAPAHRSAAIVACGGALHVADHHRGTDWVVDRLAEIVAEHDVESIGVDPAGPAAALLPDLEARFGFRSERRPDGLVVLLDGRDTAQACEQLLAAALDGSLRHRDEHALNAAVAGAGRRQSGDAWRWSRRDSDADISPLVAATLAWFLWRRVVREAPKPFVIVA